MVENEKLDDDISNKNICINVDDTDSENPMEINSVSNEKEESKEKEQKDNSNNDNVKLDERNDSSFDEKDDEQNLKLVEYKIILVGDSGVGKTSILKKFINNEFNEDIKCTINIDFFSKSIKIDKNLYTNLKIYDTAGQEKYRALIKNYYQGTDGIILVFDLTNENSFNKLKSWINEVSDNTEKAQIILVGNKADLIERKIDEETAENFAKQRDMKYIETSAKEGTNILLLFEELALDINKKKQNDSSVVELEHVDTYVFRRREINKEIKNKKENKCC
jgi:small GTP-binding protein